MTVLVVVGRRSSVARQHWLKPGVPGLIHQQLLRFCSHFTFVAVWTPVKVSKIQYSYNINVTTVRYFEEYLLHIQVTQLLFQKYFVTFKFFLSLFPDTSSSISPIF